MPSTSAAVGAEDPPVPVAATSIDDLAGVMRELRAWAGNPSYTTLARRVARLRQARGVPADEATPGRVTVYDCFRDGRRRLDPDLVVDIAAALGATREQLAVWRQSIRRVLTPGTGPVQAEVISRPPAPEPFIGRARELHQVLGAAAEGSVGIEGMPGAGKTTLALQAAHTLAEELSADDLLLVNLRGFSLDQQPVDPDSAADALLRVLAPRRQPEPGRRLAALAEILSRRAVVLVLDNAASAEQVELLVPPAGSPSRALVTSRNRLGELDRLHVVPVEALSTADATALLEQAAGRRLDDPAAAERLVTMAGQLPLALSLMGRRIAARPDWPLADHVTAYQDRLGLLRLDQAVTAALDVSYAALDAADQQILRAMAWHPGQRMGLEAVQALTGRPETAAGLARLVQASLVRLAAPDRWELHDLVRTHAAGRSLDADPPSDRVAAVSRLCRLYVDQAAAAVRALHPHAASDWSWIEQDALPALDVESATSWLNTERVNLLACAAWAAQHGRHPFTQQTAAVLAYDLWQRGDVDTTLEVHRAAVAAAAALEDEAGEALAQRNTGNTLLRAGRFEAARPHLDRALALFGAAGVDRGVMATLSSLAILASAIGDQDEAIAVFTRLVGLLREGEPEERLAIALSNLGVALIRADRGPEALPLLEESAALAAEHGWPHREQAALTNVASLLFDDGRQDEALRAARRALELAELLDDPMGVAYARSNLGVVLHSAGQHQEADEQWRAALAGSRELAAPDLEAATLNNIADGHLRLGETAAARGRYESALVLAREIAEGTETQRAEKGLAALA